jgi:hypothetical protein
MFASCSFFIVQISDPYVSIGTAIVLKLFILFIKKNWPPHVRTFGAKQAWIRNYNQWHPSTHAHKSPPLVSILRQMVAAHTLPCYIFKLGFNIKNTLFWDLTPRNLIEVYWRFGGTYLPLFSRSKSKPCKQLARSYEMQYVPLKRRWTSTGMHGVTSQKIVLFILTASRTSKPTISAYI